MQSENLLSLKDAADQLGISVKAIRHRLKVRKMKPRKVPVPFGVGFLLTITEEDLKTLSVSLPRGPQSGKMLEDEDLYPTLRSDTGYIPAEIHRLALETLRSTICDLKETYLEQTAREKLQKEEIQKKYDLLSQENSERIKIWELEKNQLVEALKIHTGRSNKLDKVPGWIRKFFGVA